MSSVFYVNDTSSVPNWGSQATTLALRKMVLDAGFRIAHTKYETGLRQVEANPHLSLSSYLPDVIRGALGGVARADPARLYKSFKDVADVVPRRYEQFESYAEAALNDGVYEFEKGAIDSADVVLINVEGLMFRSSSRCTRSLLFIAYLATEYYDTECVITNVTLDSHDEYLLDMVESLFPRVDEVVFREPVSAERYGHLCDTYRIAADPVFYLPDEPGQGKQFASDGEGTLDVRPYSTTGFDPSKPYICVAGSSIFQTESTYPVDGYESLCRELKEVCPQVLLTVSARADEHLLAPVAERMGLDMVGLNLSVRDSLDLLANASLYVGGRYHPTIFSLKGGVPIIPFSANTHKIEGLLDLVGLDAEVFDPFSLPRTAGRIRDLARARLDSGAIQEQSATGEDLSELAYKNVGYLAEVDQ